MLANEKPILASHGYLNKLTMGSGSNTDFDWTEYNDNGVLDILTEIQSIDISNGVGNHYGPLFEDGTPWVSS